MSLEFQKDRLMTSATGDARIETIFSEAEIAKRLDELASEIAESSPPSVLVVPILKGSFVFAADLLRALHRAGMAPDVDFLTLSSYRKARISSGQVAILRDLDLHVDGRHVILIDDVLDSGRTLAFAKDLIAARGAASVRTCVLLDKKAPRAVDVAADYHAFVCPNVFVVGYGMDVAHRYRELPFVGRLVG
jgi:hypoxanthine phosphoribosyltransferase